MYVQEWVSDMKKINATDEEFVPFCAGQLQVEKSYFWKTNFGPNKISYKVLNIWLSQQQRFLVWRTKIGTTAFCGAEIFFIFLSSFFFKKGKSVKEELYKQAQRANQENGVSRLAQYSKKH